MDFSGIAIDITTLQPLVATVLTALAAMFLVRKAIATTNKS